MKNALVINRIITLVFIIFVCINFLTSLNLFVYSALLVLFLVIFITAKQWFCVSLNLCFLALALIPYGLHFIIFFIVVLLIPKLRGTLIWLKKGKYDNVSGLLIVITSILSIIVLLVWAHWSNYLGVGVDFFTVMMSYCHVGVLCASIPVLAIINAFIEESIFRGALQEALISVFGGKYIPIIIQSIPFASLHYAIGFPNGIIGFLMVFVWGLALGYLRERSRGLLSPMICHIVADMTIFYYLLFYVTLIVK